MKEVSETILGILIAFLFVTCLMVFAALTDTFDFCI